MDGVHVVVGGTGNVGREVVKGLLERGATARVPTRRPDSSAANLWGRGAVEVVPAELDRYSDVASALRGACAALLAFPTVAAWPAMQRTVLSALAAERVANVVMVSVAAASRVAPSVSLREHAVGEDALCRTHSAVTVLRPSSFMQNLGNYHSATIKEHESFYHCTGDARLAFVDVRDVAAVAVNALLDPPDSPLYRDLTGPESLSHAEVAAELSHTIGREIRYVDLAADAWSQALKHDGAPEWLAVELANIYGRGPWREGAAARVSGQVEELLGRPPRTFRSFANEHSELWQASD